jgi:multidrug efflux pump subunit AcrB
MRSGRTGLAGRLARAFIHSPLTPLLMLASLLLGVFAVLVLPREEEPQIVVPMVDVFVQMPGAAPSEVEQRVTGPLEKLLWEVPGVEYLYSTSSTGQSTVIVRFFVGENEQAALVRLNQKLQANLDLVPPGASMPLVKARSIDDVPVMAVTLSGDGWDDHRLRQLAAQVRDGLKEAADVSEVTLIGGRPRQLLVTVDPSRLAAHGLDPLQIRDAIARTNARQRAGELVQGGAASIIEAGTWANRASDVAATVVAGTRAPILLRDVATLTDGPAEPTSYVVHHRRDGRAHPAVTIAIAKRAGTNAIDLTRRIERKLDTMRGVVIPSDVDVTTTRNYGETAAEKSNELLWHMLLAVLSVSALIWLALGRRESAVVLIAIPVTLALTLFVFYLYGYTLNRITLFALIFSIGILVDDAIVVVENLVRHARLQGERETPFASIAVRAVDEVGNPTILATLTVIAAILPMAFVGGLMGPYMRPIPVGASAAMVFSLLVAFVVTPWAAIRVLSRASHDQAQAEDRLTLIYRRVMSRLLASRRSQLLFLGSVAALLLAAIACIPLGLVTVKMLPFDNKSEFQVLVNMTEGTPLEETARVAGLLADGAMAQPDVVSVQSYVGTSSPYNFNGLVRHYFLRRAPHQADLQVNLKPKDERRAQSHEIALRMREVLTPVAQRLGARIQVAEVPPGPPVLQTLVAEVYGPDPVRRLAIAQDVKNLFTRTPGVVDVDWYVEAPQHTIELAVDAEGAAAAGVAPAHVGAVARMAASGEVTGLVHDPDAREDVPIVLRLPLSDRRSVETLMAIRLRGAVGTPSIGELVRASSSEQAPSLYHKNLMPVTYVTGDVAGGSESPVYAILQMNRALAEMRLPEGYALDVFSAAQPEDSTRYAMKWDGEWHITYEVFRDLGIAFAAVLVLIYILVVGWFESFVTPLVIMAAIPFSLVGILPAHAALGAFFTATSMIGFIAGAGIVVRNSIILVDFIELRRRGGMALDQAVIDAGAVRFRPMALTASAVAVGSAVILFDPIFQGLAISLMAGEVASLLLSRITVPVLYHLLGTRYPIGVTLALDEDNALVDATSG